MLLLITTFISGAACGIVGLVFWTMRRSNQPETFRANVRTLDGKRVVYFGDVTWGDDQ